MNKEQPNPFEICSTYLKRPNTVYNINKKWQDKVFKSLSLIDQTIVKINNNENVDDFDFKIIEEVINLLTNLTFQIAVDERLKDFIHAYVFLAHNINENTFKYPVVSKKIQYLQRFTENCLTYSETQNLFRKVSTNFSNMKLTTPSFRLSQHYYDLLK
jgi:hypothetical protein